MTRKQFILSAVAAIPFVGKMVKPRNIHIRFTESRTAFTYNSGRDPQLILGDDAYTSIDDGLAKCLDIATNTGGFRFNSAPVLNAITEKE